MQHTASHTTAIQSPSRCQWYVLIGKQWYRMPEFIPSNSNSGLHSCCRSYRKHLFSEKTLCGLSEYQSNTWQPPDQAISKHTALSSPDHHNLHTCFPSHNVVLILTLAATIFMSPVNPPDYDRNWSRMVHIWWTKPNIETY